MISHNCSQNVCQCPDETGISCFVLPGVCWLKEEIKARGCLCTSGRRAKGRLDFQFKCKAVGEFLSLCQGCESNAWKQSLPKHTICVPLRQWKGRGHRRPVGPPQQRADQICRRAVVEAILKLRPVKSQETVMYCFGWLQKFQYQSRLSITATVPI